MKLNIGITAALLLVFAHAHAQAQEQGQEPGKRETIKVPITTIQGSRKPSTVGRWVHALRKYGLSTAPATGGSGGPKGVQRGRVVDPTKIARIPLVDFDFDREYYGTVMVGDPPQSFKVDFDTGSSQFILSTKGCSECSGDNHYDASVSRTFRTFDEPLDTLKNTNSDDNTTTTNINNSTLFTSSPASYISPSAARLTADVRNSWHITYGDYSHAEGFLGRDQVLLNGLKIQNQALALVTSESAGFDDTIDGIMGLAFGALSSGPHKFQTVFESMMDQKLIDQGVFSFYLGKSKLGGGGEVVFGGIDFDRIKKGEKLVYTPVTKAKYWQINVENLYVDTGDSLDVEDEGGAEAEEDWGEAGFWKRDVKRNHNRGKDKIKTSQNVQLGRVGSGNKGASNVPGIMDTGTTLMIVPLQIANAIHALIPGARPFGPSWAVPCGLGQQYPQGKVELEIEGHRFAIPFDDMVREKTQSGPVGDSEDNVADNANITEEEEEPQEDGEELDNFEKRSSGTSHKSHSKSQKKSNQRDKKKSNEDDEEEDDTDFGAMSINTRGLCFSGIQPSSAKFMIIGDVFIKSNLVVFDQENQQVGIAPLRFDEVSTAKVSAAHTIAEDESADEKDYGEHMYDLRTKKAESKKKHWSHEKQTQVVDMRVGWQLDIDDV